MDLSKLSQNEKLALYGAIVVFLAGIISNWGGLLYLSILAAVGVAIVLFLPQLSPKTSLPGSRGSLLAVLGLIAFGGAAIELLRYLGYTFDTLGRFSTLLFIVALIGSAVMAWAGWQELQREGGRWVLGGSGATGTEPAAPAPAATSAPEPMAAAEPESAAPSAPSADAGSLAEPTAPAEPPADDPYRPDDEDRPPA
ncbi:MAG TPA: hypothetical protein VF365_12820 [Candidatus Limnocylindria bacterium]